MSTTFNNTCPYPPGQRSMFPKSVVKMCAIFRKIYLFPCNLPLFTNISENKTIKKHRNTDFRKRMLINVTAAAQRT